MWFRLAALALLLPLAAPVTVLADDAPEVMHFELLGPDWARAPKGPGVLPEKVVAELDIPVEYVTRHSSFPLFQPPKKTTSSIPIDVFYPSMKGAADTESPDAVRIVLGASGHGEEAARNGTSYLLHREGKTRAEQLDVGGLCGYVDNEHPGLAGDEFYVSCNPQEQTFFITCFPQFNNHRICTENNSFSDLITATIIYQYAMLKDHVDMYIALKTLVQSFVKFDPDSH